MNLARDELLPYSAFSLQEDGEVRSGNALNGVAERVHDRRGADERRGGVALGPIDTQQPGAGQLAPGSFDLEDEAGEMGGQAEQLKIPFADRRTRLERGLENAGAMRIRPRYFKRD